MRLNGSLVDTLCDARRISNRELARQVGCTPQFLLRLRRDERTASEGTIKSIGDVLGVPLAAVMLPHRPVKDAS
jgi:transcriptional regulator with XRE-family HTH domain